MTALLEVKDLEVAFFTKDGIVRAVNRISYSLEEGDILGVVGESGCGKSVSMMSMLRLLPEPPAKIMGGQVLFNGHDLLQMKLSRNQPGARRGNCDGFSGPDDFAQSGDDDWRPDRRIDAG